MLTGASRVSGQPGLCTHYPAPAPEVYFTLRNFDLFVAYAKSIERSRASTMWHVLPGSLHP